MCCPIRYKGPWAYDKGTVEALRRCKRFHSWRSWEGDESSDDFGEPRARCPGGGQLWGKVRLNHNGQFLLQASLPVIYSRARKTLFSIAQDVCIVLVGMCRYFLWDVCVFVLTLRGLTATEVLRFDAVRPCAFACWLSTMVQIAFYTCATSLTGSCQPSSNSLQMPHLSQGEYITCSCA